MLGAQHSRTPAWVSGLLQRRGVEMAALKMEYVCAQARCRFAHGGLMVVMLMARGVEHCWCSPSMWHAMHAARVHQYSEGPPSLPLLSWGGESSRFSEPPHSAPSLPQEDSGVGVRSQHTVLPLAQPWESGGRLGGAEVTLQRLFPDLSW